MRRAFREMGATPEVADEAVDAVDNFAYGRHESDMRFAQMMAEHRAQLAEIRNQFLLGVLIIVGIAVGILAWVN